MLNNLLLSVPVGALPALLRKSLAMTTRYILAPVIATEVYFCGLKKKKNRGAIKKERKKVKRNPVKLNFCC